VAVVRKFALREDTRYEIRDTRLLKSDRSMQRALEIPEDVIQNMGIHASISTF